MVTTTKQEEIMGRIAEIAFDYAEGEILSCVDCAVKILNHLHSKGVAIKVEGELPILVYERGIDSATGSGIFRRVESAGYTKTIPLIEEDGNGKKSWEFEHQP